MTKCVNICTKRLSTFQITVCASVYYAAELHLSSSPKCTVSISPEGTACQRQPDGTAAVCEATTGGFDSVASFLIYET